MSRSACSAIIVGAGIVGSACALEFASNGIATTVIEGECVGAGATAAGMGHIVVMDDSDAQFALTQYSQQLWQDLAPELPRSCEYIQTGTLWVAADDEEMGEVRRKHEYYSQRAVPSQVVEADQIPKLEPELRPGLAGGLLIPEDAVIYPPGAAAYLLARAEQHGATVRVGRNVASINDSGVHFTDGSLCEGDIYVNAAGSKAGQLTSGLQILPRKGHLVITERYPGFLRHQLVELGYLKSAHQSTEDSVAFNVQPRSTGQILIGSSRQYGSDDASIDHAMLVPMLARATKYMPRLASLAAIRAWTGIRAATADKLPLIGRVSGYERVYAAAGHEGLGITTSLGTARLLVDEILGRKSEIDREAYAAGRKVSMHV